MLGKLQTRIYRTVGPSLAASLKPLAHRRNVANLSLFYRYYFGKCLSELALPYSRGRSIGYSDKLHFFSFTIPRCYKDVHVNSSFPCTIRLWNYLSLCFPLTNDQNGVKSGINRHLLTVGSFKRDFLHAFMV